MTVFVVVLTAVLGMANVKMLTFPCKDIVCVADLEAHARANPHITRFQVWRAKNYSPPPIAGQPIWPPFIDERYL